MSAIGKPELVADSDGVDQWSALSGSTEGPRREILYNINEKPFLAGIRVDDYKLIWGKESRNKWYPANEKPVNQEQCDEILRDRIGNWDDFKQSKDEAMLSVEEEMVADDRKVKKKMNGKNDIQDTPSETIPNDYGVEIIPSDKIQLFNVKDDPNEKTDLSKKYPELVQQLKDKAKVHFKELVPMFMPKVDKAGLPRKGEAWGPGWCSKPYEIPEKNEVVIDPL